LRKRKFPAGVSRQLIDEVIDGLMAISLAHDQLSPTQAGEMVDLSSYIRALVTHIAQPHDGLAVEVQTDDMELGMTHAVPLGLIVNEAMTNALKYAFPTGQGRILVQLLNEGQSEAALIVKDDGVGVA